MRFKSEATRRAHPLAKLIPVAIWHNFFFDTLPDYLFPIMQSTDENLDAQLQTATPNLNSSITKQQAFFAIAFSHPHLSPEALKRFSDILLPENPLFKTDFIIGLGRLDCLTFMLENQQISLGIVLKKYDKVYDAIGDAKQNIDFLKYCAATLNGIPKNILSHATKHAAKHGHLDVLDHIAEQAPLFISTMIADGDFESYAKAARNGHLDILVHLEKLAPDAVSSMLKANSYRAFRHAAKNGQLHVLKHLLTLANALGQTEAMLSIHKYRYFTDVVARGHLGIIEHLFEVAPDKNELFRLARSIGHQSATRILMDIPAVALMARKQELSTPAFSVHEPRQLQNNASNDPKCNVPTTTQTVLSMLRANNARLLVQSPRCDEEKFKELRQKRWWQSSQRNVATMNPQHPSPQFLSIAHVDHPTNYSTPTQNVGFRLNRQPVSQCQQNQRHSSLQRLPFTGKQHQQWLPVDGSCIRTGKKASAKPSSTKYLSSLPQLKNRSIFTKTKLTSREMHQELHQFIHNHVRSIVNAENAPAIQQAWDKHNNAVELDKKDWAALKLLDISPQKQTDFKHKLHETYGFQFDEQNRFQIQIKQLFQLKDINSAHILNFGHFFPNQYWEQLLEPTINVSVRYDF